MNQFATQDIYQKILEAKEFRYRKRQRIAEMGKASVSLTLNVMGYPKSSEQIDLFFSQILKEVKNWWQANRIAISFEEECQVTDASGNFWLCPLPRMVDPHALKELCERIEETHPCGRLIDLDLSDAEGNPISSGKQKSCLFCEKDAAIFCMKSQAHDIGEVRQEAMVIMESYLEKKQEEKWDKLLCQWAIQALLVEVSLSPKPGLVDRFDSGVHTDMDFLTFMNGTASIAPYFSEAVQLGFRLQRMEEALPQIRMIGLQAEKAMFENTQKVNTQKGAIFLMLQSLFAVARSLKEGGEYHNRTVRKILKNVNNGIVKRELGKQETYTPTHGELCFLQFKSGGIREEIEGGLPLVFEYALPLLRNELKKKDCQQFAPRLQVSLTRALCLIMSLNNDTTVLFRSDYGVLQHMQHLARRHMDQMSEDSFRELNDFCLTHRISPGGSADLLAVSYFFYWVEKQMNLSNKREGMMTNKINTMLAL